MVDKFKTILDNLKKHGDVTLFAVLKMDNLTDKWSVLISATWINEDNRKEIFNEIIELIKNTMSIEEAASVARVIIAPKEDPLVLGLLEYKTVDYIGGDEPIKINGNLVHEAHILESN